MVKNGENILLGTFILILSFIMLATSIKSPLSAEKHIYLEGEIFNLEFHTDRHIGIWQTFQIKHAHYEGKYFNNRPVYTMSPRGLNIKPYFQEKSRLGFHIEKAALKAKQIKVFSLTAQGKPIIPLERKWRIKYWNMGIGVLLLICAKYLFRNS